MAKAGEGDPRWIVQAREEGDLTPWAQKELTSRLKSLPLVDNAEVSASVTKASNFEGDVTVSQRKGKRIYFYDLSIQLEWKGELKDGSLTDCKGKLELSDIEQEKKPHEFEFKLSVNGAESDAHRKIKEAVRTEGIKAIAVVIEQFQKQLRERAGVAVESSNKPTAKPSSNDMQVDQPTTTAATTSATATTTTTTNTDSTTTTTTTTTSSSSSSSAAAAKKAGTLKETHEFNCRPSDILECFIDPARVVAYTQDSRVVVPKKGGDAFAMFDGAVSGTALELKSERIELNWRLKAWPAGVLANVVMSMSFENGKTKMEFVATNFPNGEKMNVSQAWQHFYWSRIRGCFGYK